MTSKKIKGKILAAQLWCAACLEKSKPVIRPSTHLIPHREKPYDMLPGEATIDKTEIGVCEECLELKNKFQQKHALDICPIHRLEVYKQQYID